MSLKKCIVWDLDNTLWEGVCLEGKVFIKNDVIKVIKELDLRGILHSISSRGDESLSLEYLEKFKIKDYFLTPKINWLQKSNNLIAISKELNISLDSITYIDDDEFELEQVSFMLPEVLTINAKEINELPAMAEFSPASITNETKNRRYYYQAEQLRKKNEENYSSREDFLKSCCMKLKIRLMKKHDICRVVELMTRTHQLNTTGWILEQDDLLKMLKNETDSKIIYVAELIDKFGSYGIIGTAVVEINISSWKLKYLAVSCRIMGRGIERAILIKLICEAKKNGYDYIYAEFRDTGRNRMMKTLYQIMGFHSSGLLQSSNRTLAFRREIKEIPLTPNWLEIL